MTAARALCFALVAVALLGCADLRPPLTSPAQGGYPWTELTSRHYVLRTNLDAPEAKQALSEFEATYNAFTDLAFPTNEARTRRIDVVIFQRPAEYRIFGPKGSDAFFDASLANDPDPVPTAVLAGQLVASTRLVFQHELTHHFMRQSLASAPIWLNEGMAQFYSTLRVEDGKAHVGEPLPDRGFTRGKWAAVRNGTFERTFIPAPAVPSVPRLLGADRPTFYAASSSSTLDTQRAQFAFYGGAWALVHLMMTGPAAYRARFAVFIDELTRGTRSDQAWGKAFDGVDPEALQRDLYEHMLSPIVPSLVKGYTPRPSAPVLAERAMSDAEVHLLWARLAPWPEGGSAFARAELDAALADEPSSPEVHLWRGLYFLRTKQLDVADGELHAALPAGGADEPRALLALLRLEVARRVHHSPEVAALAERLARVARTATELDAVARVQQGVDGIGFAERALQADPTCWRCSDTYAILLFASKRFVDAALTAERTVALLPEYAVEPTVVRRMLAYRARAQAAAAAPPPPLPDGGSP